MQDTKKTVKKLVIVLRFLPQNLNQFLALFKTAFTIIDIHVQPFVYQDSFYHVK